MIANPTEFCRDSISLCLPQAFGHGHLDLSNGGEETEETADHNRRHQGDKDSPGVHKQARKVRDVGRWDEGRDEFSLQLRNIRIWC